MAPPDDVIVEQTASDSVNDDIESPDEEHEEIYHIKFHLVSWSWSPSLCQHLLFLSDTFRNGNFPFIQR